MRHGVLLEVSSMGIGSKVCRVPSMCVILDYRNTDTVRETLLQLHHRHTFIKAHLLSLLRWRMAETRCPREPSSHLAPEDRPTLQPRA